MKVVLGILVALLAVLYYLIILPPTIQYVDNDLEWFGYGDPQPENTTIYPYRIHIEDAAIADWRRRVKDTRFGNDLEDGNFEYGFQVNYMKEIQRHMLDKYDWRKHEAQLNQYAHFTTKIEGIDVHFLRAFPADRAAWQGRVLLLVHGWPGSVWEFMKILPRLTNPQAYGGKAQDAFEVICPSIPGYGFSEAPKQRGFGISDAARFFAELMKRLGHKTFYYQGGDYGAVIGSTMGQLYGNRMVGLHLNMIVVPFRSPRMFAHRMLASLLPSLLLSAEDRPRLKPFLEEFMHIIQETGYMHIQATKPDTVAMALMDSPVGLAGYILEKFSTWTNPAYRELPDGGLTEKYELDDLLTNVMIYWYTGTIGSSLRYYKELFTDPVLHKLEHHPVHVPTGLASFPHEIGAPPQALAAHRYKNIVQYSDMPRGGHFAASEEPELLAQDFFLFVKKLEKLETFGA